MCIYKHMYVYIYIHTYIYRLIYRFEGVLHAHVITQMPNTYVSGDQSPALPQWSAGTHRRRRGLATASGLTDKFTNVSVSSNKPMLETPNDKRSDNVSRDL